uniref:Uncharacterized protein n=1 Tax=Romanomermis culicivorax TaxID=13658 RepID=A0A915JKI5_ROMCU
MEKCLEQASCKHSNNASGDVFAANESIICSIMLLETRLSTKYICSFALSSASLSGQNYFFYHLSQFLVKIFFSLVRPLKFWTIDEYPPQKGCLATTTEAPLHIYLEALKHSKRDFSAPANSALDRCGAGRFSSGHFCVGRSGVSHFRHCSKDRDFRGIGTFGESERSRNRDIG